MPNLKFLWLKSSKFPLTPGLLPKFKNLTSLEITARQNLHEILAPIGPKLKELGLRGSSTDKNSFSNLVKVLTVCPNLEALYLKNFKGSVVMDAIKGAKLLEEYSKKLKLKKVELEGEFLRAEGLLPLLFLSPPLEEVVLDFGLYHLLDVRVLVHFLEMKMMFQSVTTVDISLRLEKYRSQPFSLEACGMMMATGELARNIISFSPKLHTANLYFCDSSDREMGPFVDLVKAF